MDLLPDDILFTIFEYLPAKNVVKLEIICKRWQALVYTWFRYKLQPETDFTEWIKKYNLENTFDAVTKFLSYGADKYTKITLNSEYWDSRILKKIGKYCPNLHTLVIYLGEIKNGKHIEVFAKSCKKLKIFDVRGNFAIKLGDLNSLFIDPVKLEVLKCKSVNGTAVFDISSPQKLPASLNEIRICRFIGSKKNLIENVTRNCPFLESFRVAFALEPNLIKVLGEKLFYLRELQFFPTEYQVDLTVFSKLKTLIIYGHYYMTHLFKTCTGLEELKTSWIDDTVEADFSLLLNLKKLEIRNQVLATPAVKKSISNLTFCKNLKMLTFAGGFDSIEYIIEIIRKCSNLQELRVAKTIVYSDNIQNFVNANKYRSLIDPLKLAICFDNKALELMHKLYDAGYDIEVLEKETVVYRIGYCRVVGESEQA